VAWNGAHLTW